MHCPTNHRHHAFRYLADTSRSPEFASVHECHDCGELYVEACYAPVRGEDPRRLRESVRRMEQYGILPPRVDRIPDYQPDYGVLPSAQVMRRLAETLRAVKEKAGTHTMAPRQLDGGEGGGHGGDRQRRFDGSAFNMGQNLRPPAMGRNSETPANRNGR